MRIDCTSLEVLNTEQGIRQEGTYDRWGADLRFNDETPFHAPMGLAKRSKRPGPTV